MIDLVEPNNREAEEKLIACLCVGGDSSAYDSVSSILTEDDFYFLRHRLLFKAVAHLSETSTPIDEITIMEYLKSIECLDEVEGVTGIIDILSKSNSSMQLKHCTDIVLEKAHLRRLRRAYILGAENASAETATSQQIKADVEEQTSRVSQTADSGQAVQDTANELKQDFAAMMSGEYVNDVVRTHLSQLDSMLGSGGIGAGEVLTLSAPTSCGKSALALYIATQAMLKEAVPTLIFSLEMPRKQIIKRMVQAISGANLRQIQERVISDKNLQKVHEATDMVAGLPFYSIHTARNPQDVISQARNYVKKHGVKLVVIDYLQLIPWSSKAKSKAEGIADISHKVKQLALELNVSVILLSQVNREGAKRETGLSLYDLKDSGDIENDADIVLLLWPKNGDIEGAKSSDAKGPFTELQYTIAKNREGERGVGGYLKFYHCLGRFK